MPPYPLPNLTGEEYNKFKENEFLDVTEHPLSTFSIDVDNASYTNSRRYINDGMLPPHDAIRIEEFINYFDYDYTQPKSDDPVSIITEISECPWNPDNRLIHVGLQGKTISYKKLPPSNIVFLLDVSGSMSSPDKLPLLKSSFKLLIEELRKKDKVAIVVYASSTGMVLESTPGNEKEKLHEAVDRLHSGGSTAGGAGIQLAYKTAKENFIKKGNNRVILATDGDFNVGTTDNDALVKLIREKANDGIFLTVLGFGTGNLKDERMEHIADKGNGNYHYIDNILEGKKALVKEMGGLFTIAKDVKLQIEFNPARIQAYRLIGYENRMLAARDFNDDTKDAGEIGSGHTVTALYEIMLPGMDAVRRPAVDPLKYQKAEIVTTGEFEDEVMTVKLRYKPPDEDTSKLIVRAVKDEHIQLRKTSDNFRFSAAVAEFGLLLRDSEFKANASYEQIIRLAKDAKGKDTEGYRAEFIRLVETGELLSK